MGTESRKMFLVSKVWPVRGVENLIAICEPIA
jgi:hypothetical protein